MDTSTETSHLPSQTQAKPKGSWGAVLSICILLALFVLAALYVWGERVHEEGGVVPVQEGA